MLTTQIYTHLTVTGALRWERSPHRGAGTPWPPPPHGRPDHPSQWPDPPVGGSRASIPHLCRTRSRCHLSVERNSYHDCHISVQRNQFEHIFILQKNNRDWAQVPSLRQPSPKQPIIWHLPVVRNSNHACHCGGILENTEYIHARKFTKLHYHKPLK